MYHASLVPSPPRNVDVTQLNATSIRVSWEPPERGEILGYYVYKYLLVNGQVTKRNKPVAINDQNVSGKARDAPERP